MIFIIYHLMLCMINKIINDFIIHQFYWKFFYFLSKLQEFMEHFIILKIFLNFHFHQNLNIHI